MKKLLAAVLAAGFLGEDYDYDFRLALDYPVDGYDVRIGRVSRD